MSYKEFTYASNSNATDNAPNTTSDTQSGTPAERNTRLYGCPLGHTPNAETIKSFSEPVIRFNTLEEFLADLHSDD